MSGSLWGEIRTYIDGHEDDIVAQFLGHLVSLGRAEVAEHHLRSRPGESLHSSLPQTTGSTGDQTYAVLLCNRIKRLLRDNSAE